MHTKSNGNFMFSLNLIRKFGFSYLIASAILSMFEMVIPIVNVYGLKTVLDSIESKKTFHEIFQFICFLFWLMAVSYLFASWYKRYYSPLRVQKIQIKMRENFYDIASKVDLKYYDDTDFYNKYVKALSEAESRIFRLIDDLAGIVGIISCLITVILLAVSMNWWVLLFSALFIIANLSLSIVAQNISFQEANESVASQRQMSYVDRVFYLYQYAKEVRSYSLKYPLMQRLQKSGQNKIRVIKKYSVKQTIITLAMSGCNILYILGIMTFLAYNAVSGTISVGDFAALLTASQSFNGQVENLFSIIPKVRENVLYISFLKEFMDNPSSIEKKQDGVYMPFGQAATIEFENTRFQYPNTNNEVISGISEVVHRGEVVVVVGENGVGKSTLLKLLLRLYDVTDGSIRYNGVPITEYNISSLRSNIGIVFQDFQHYAMTIRENLCFGDCELSDQELYDALRKVGLEKKIRELPNGLDSMISCEFDENGVEFSGGEYQKLALARALILKQGIIIFDEPSSSLDPNSEKQFFDDIKDLCSNRTAIIVSHRLSVAKCADRILLLKNGVIFEKGTHAELMKLNNEYATMFNNQAENYIS